MNIAFVSNVVFPFVKGGAEKRIHELGTRLVERGHDITVYTRHWWDGSETIENEGMTLRAVGSERELYADDRRSIAEALKFGTDVVVPLRRNASEHDIVVVSVFPYFPVVGARLGLLGTDTPMVTTWLEVWDDYWDDYLGRLAPFGKAVERVTARIPQHPVAISSVTADRLAAFRPDDEEIAIVPGGIDVSRIRSVPPADDGFDVLFAGRLISDKNVDLLLSAFDTVAEGHRVTLGIIGEGPERSYLRRKASRLSHAEDVSFLGFLDEYEDVLAQMRAADLFVSPSTREGFGITLAEAMAADCSVVTVDHPESAGASVVGDGGFVTEPTASSVADAMDRALRGETPPREPVEVAAEHDWDAIAEKAERVYATILERGVTPPARP